MDFISGEDREQTLLLPDNLEDYVNEDNPARVIDAFAAIQSYKFWGQNERIL